MTKKSPTFSKIFQKLTKISKIFQNFTKIDKNLQNFSKIDKNLQNFPKIDKNLRKFFEMFKISRKINVLLREQSLFPEFFQKQVVLVKSEIFFKKMICNPRNGAEIYRCKRYTLLL